MEKIYIPLYFLCMGTTEFRNEGKNQKFRRNSIELVTYKMMKHWL